MHSPAALLSVLKHGGLALVASLSFCGFAQAQTFTLATNTTDWRLSTTVDTSNNTVTPWPGLSSASLPVASTYTIVPTATGSSVVTALPGTQVLFAGGGVRFYRTTFTLNPFSALTLDVRANVDNDVQVFFNGTSLALEGSLSSDNFGGAPLHVSVAADGTVTNGANGDQPFDSAAAVYDPNARFFAGTNEVVLAVRNLGNASGGDSGAISFSATFNVTPSGAAAAEPSALALVTPVAPLAAALLRRRRRCRA